MPNISSQHRHFKIAIDRIMSQYEEELKSYDSFMKKQLKSSIDIEAKIVNHGVLKEWIRISEELTSAKYSLVILASAYIEAIANFYLSQKLSKEQFEEIERKNILEKWVDGIKKANEKYQLPKGRKLYNRLKTLKTTRNDLVHHKPKYRNEGKEIHKSSKL